MTSILNRFKSLAIGATILLFFMGVTLSSCNPADKGSENTESVEAAADSEEHPKENEEHPKDDEAHATSDEEHPSDSTKEEHPSKEEQ